MRQFRSFIKKDRSLWALPRRRHIINGGHDPPDGSLGVPEFGLVSPGIVPRRRLQNDAYIHDFLQPQAIEEFPPVMGEQRQKNDRGLSITGKDKEWPISICFGF